MWMFMQFELMNFLMNPFVLMFTAVIAGILFGKIKFGKFSFGISGTLFTGLFIGWLVFRLGERVLAQGEGAEGFKAANTMMANGIISSDFFNFFLILFVAAVGLLASKDMKAVIKKYGIRFVVLGILVTFVGGAMTYGVTLAFTSGESSASAYEVSGVYTGALTSSPGLAAALETARKHSEGIDLVYENATLEEKQEILDIVAPGENLDPDTHSTLTAGQVQRYQAYAEAGVGIGHAVAYPFGVLIVILGVNFFPRLFRMNIEEEWKRYEEEMKDAKDSVEGKAIPEVPFNILTFFLTTLAGYLFGQIQIYMGPLGYFSLGATGGTLIMALLLGYIGKIGPLNFRMEEKVLIALRQIGLAFFLAIVGLRYGGKVVASLSQSGMQLVVAATLVSVVALLFGFLLGRYVFKLNWILLSGAICGGMTSTPGMGAAVDALGSDKPAAGYGATYPFALLTKVILVIILHKLPM
jgi:putative transport protein